MTESADDNIVDSVDDDISMFRNNCTLFISGHPGQPGNLNSQVHVAPNNVPHPPVTALK